MEQLIYFLQKDAILKLIERPIISDKISSEFRDRDWMVMSNIRSQVNRIIEFQVKMRIQEPLKYLTSLRLTDPKKNI